ASIGDDDPSARLVIMKPQQTHSKDDKKSQARQAALQMLEKRGNVSRNYRNALVFLAPDRQRIEDLKQQVRQYRAWQSIVDEREELNLDAFQYRVAQKHVSDSLKSIHLLIPQAYIWLLVPDQPDRRVQSDDMLNMRLQPQPDQGEGLLAAVASSVLINAE